MRIVRYFFVGGVAALIDFTTFGILTKIVGLPWFPVAVFSFVLATSVNYALSVRYVFASRVRFARHHEVLLVFLASAIGLFVNQTVLWFLIESAGWDPLAAKIPATGIVFFWNYGARRNVIFKPKG